MKTNRFPYFLIILPIVIAVFWLTVKDNVIAAPELTFTTITGKKIALKDFRGKPVLVTFWATDCPACIKEIPHLLELYREFHERGLEIIAISMFYDPPSHVVAMTEAKQLPYPVVLDLTGQYAHAFGDVMLTPNTFLISPEGMIADHALGPAPLPSLKNQIKHYLKG